MFKGHYLCDPLYTDWAPATPLQFYDPQDLSFLDPTVDHCFVSNCPMLWDVRWDKARKYLKETEEEEKTARELEAKAVTRADREATKRRRRFLTLQYNNAINEIVKVQVEENESKKTAEVHRQNYLKRKKIEAQQKANEERELKVTRDRVKVLLERIEEWNERDWRTKSKMKVKRKSSEIAIKKE